MRVFFYVCITCFVLRAFFPYLGLVRQQSVLSLKSIILYHQFFISSGVQGIFSFFITLLHCSFHIRCADSDIRILHSLFTLGCFSPFILQLAITQLTMLPTQGYCHSRFFWVHIYLASSHISFCLGVSQCISIWSMVSGTLQCGHSLLFCISSLKFPFNQYLLTLYALCMVIHKKYHAFLEKSLCWVAFHI